MVGGCSQRSDSLQAYCGGNVGKMRTSDSLNVFKVFLTSHHMYDVRDVLNRIIQHFHTNKHFYFPSCQSKLHMEGFRSLKEGEAVEFTYKKSSKGLESQRVTGPGGIYCVGSERRPKGKKVQKRRSRWALESNRGFKFTSLNFPITNFTWRKLKLLRIDVRNTYLLKWTSKPTIYFIKAFIWERLSWQLQ